MIIALRGYGTFIYAGTVAKNTYEYFEDEDIDLQEYAEYLDDPESSNLKIPKEHDFVDGGCLYDMDNLWCISGAELTSDCILSVDLENGDDDWECSLDLGTLEKLGIKTKCISSSTRVIMDLPSDTAIFMAKETTEGLQFEENQIISSSDFDPTKLEIYYHEYIDTDIIKHIKYDGREYFGSNFEWDAKDKEFKWLLW
ncbi:hypothetical protein ACS8E3_06290 [Psychrobacter sp. 2Y5]|uniref:hypothetical protein n=1 Tax=unclassified Psychrobacter TaxID=196806 RepID=UPI000C33B8FB|nr:hypothetical protein [Psychrobacter sp. Sarcosine-3u-12]PKG35693.1 hypothetical protein CXF65_06125 [Psychrobacter sp. Sarcosine-3u-12]